MGIGVALPRGRRDEFIALALVSSQLLFSLLIEPRYQPIESHGPGAIGQS